MEIRVLRYFWTVAQEGNISKAARLLNITQPTLSRQIKEFEEALGMALFHREKNQLALTQAGYFLKERAEEILLLDKKLEQDLLEQAHKQLEGTISIGCVEADNSDTVAMMVEELVNDFPQIHFTIITATSEDIMDRLEKGLIDIALLIEPVAVTGVELLVLPREERWGFLVSKELFIAQNQTIQPKDILGLPIMCSMRQEVQQLLAEWSQCSIEELTIVGQYNLIFNVLAFVKNQVAVALTIEGAVLNRPSDETVFLPLEPGVKTNCVLVWKKRVQVPAVQELINRFKDAFEV